MPSIRPDVRPQRERDTQRFELFRQPASSNPKNNPAASQTVHRRHLLGNHHRVTQNGQQNPNGDLSRVGRRGNIGKRHNGIESGSSGFQWAAPSSEKGNDDLVEVLMSTWSVSHSESTPAASARTAGNASPNIRTCAP